MNHEPSVVAKRLQGYFQYTNLESFEPAKSKPKILRKEPSVLESLLIAALTRAALSLTKAALKTTRWANKLQKKYD